MILRLWWKWCGRFCWDIGPVGGDEPQPSEIWLVERWEVGLGWALERRGGNRVVPIALRPAAELPGWAVALGARGADSAEEIKKIIRECEQAGAVPCVVTGGGELETVAAWLKQAGVRAVALDWINAQESLFSRCRQQDWSWSGAGRWVWWGQRAEGEAADDLRKALLRAGERVFSRHPDLERHLGEVVVRSLKSQPWRTVVVDAFQGNRRLSALMLLGVSWWLADWLRREVEGRRVGIVLPPGAGGVLVNLGCLLVGKVPVNLNFTAGRTANERAMARAGIRQVITAEAVARKLEQFPWPEQRYDVKELLAGAGRWRLLGRAVVAALCPAGILCRLMGVPRQGGGEEAGLLFTSGSSGDPKGVVLTHRNLLANIAQVHAVLPRREIGSVLGCLPIFHSFGFTVTLWWPLAGGPRVVTYVSPLDTARLIEVVREHQIGLLVTTPTFLRAFLRKAEREDLRSLRLVVTGAEKLPMGLLEEFEKKFEVPVCEGYGMTETAPVISTNLTDELVRARGGRLPGRVPGTVGRPLRGIDVRVTHAVSGQELPLSQSGLLSFKGANVFPGYLADAERSAAVLQDGWYQSGDVGRMTPEGFLVIEGRLSRFSKIGGEMVPHGTVEAELMEALRGCRQGELTLAVVGIRDEKKGEALVVLCNQPLTADEVRKGLTARGLPNLWIPRECFQVETVPVLASGKLDLRGCQELAERLAQSVDG